MDCLQKTMAPLPKLFCPLWVLYCRRQGGAISSENTKPPIIGEGGKKDQSYRPHRKSENAKMLSFSEPLSSSSLSLFSPPCPPVLFPHSLSPDPCLWVCRLSTVWARCPDKEVSRVGGLRGKGAAFDFALKCWKGCSGPACGRHEVKSRGSEACDGLVPGHTWRLSQLIPSPEGMEKGPFP